MIRETAKFGISDKRGRARTSDNPYLQSGLKEPSYCSECNAVYQHKRWNLVAESERPEQAHATVCPSCQKIADSFALGIVTLQGDYLWQHEEDIRNMLLNEEQKVRSKNPLARIMRLEREGDRLVIETTEQKLAEHLGRALHKAHQGDLNISRPKDHLNCRVSWERLH